MFYKLREFFQVILGRPTAADRAIASALARTDQALDDTEAWLAARAAERALNK